MYFDVVITNCPCGGGGGGDGNGAAERQGDCLVSPASLPKARRTSVAPLYIEYVRSPRDDTSTYPLSFFAL